MRHFIRSTRHFQQLQWKLTVSYTLTTVLALLLVECIIGVVVLNLVETSAPHYLANVILQKGHDLAPYLNTVPVDPAKIHAELQTVKPSLATVAVDYQGYIAIVDTNTHLVTSLGDHSPFSTTDLRLTLPATINQQLHTVLLDPTLSSARLDQINGHTYVLSSIIDTDRHVKGAILVDATHVQISFSYLVNTFPRDVFLIVISIVFFILCAGIVGSVFGFVSTRGMVRRFRRLFSAVDDWSQGDFSVIVQDSSGDELGQLARQLNHMAEQLQSWLQTRQSLVLLEERNRLARDLHDSVKQQVFAVSMQISTAKALVATNTEGAQTHLAAAEKLVRQTQSELTSLIKELRPVALAGKGLARALQDLVADWQIQTGIEVTIQVTGEKMVSILIEEALFRVTQEALSNIVRHSQAHMVQINLICNDLVFLSITDDGCGFDVSATARYGVGLHSMQERIKNLGGQVTIVSVPGNGTTISVCCS